MISGLNVWITDPGFETLFAPSTREAQAGSATHGSATRLCNTRLKSTLWWPAILKILNRAMVSRVIGYSLPRGQGVLGQYI